MVEGPLAGVWHVLHVHRSEHRLSLYLHRRPEIRHENEVRHVDGHLQKGPTPKTQFP